VNPIWKLVILLALIFVVVFISINSKREPSYLFKEGRSEASATSDYSTSILQDATLSQLATEITSQTPVQSMPESITQPDNIADDIAEPENLVDMTDISTSSNSVPIIILNEKEEDYTTNEKSGGPSFPSHSPEELYQEMTAVEQAVRRYLSAGYKISSLNSDSLYKEGYMEKDMADKYTVTFRASGDGYDIVISPKLPLEESVMNSLVQKNKIKKVEQNIEYVFWIKAYRN